MKNSAEIVIIGAGISGCSIAYNLAKKGVKNIVVIEKNYICSGSTGRCGAGVRMQWGTEMNCKIGKKSIEFYENANEILEYKRDVEFKQSGYLLIADTDKEIKQFKKNIEVQHVCGIPSKMLSLEEAKEIVPYLNTNLLKGAAFCEKDGFLNPFHTTDAFYSAAKKLGVEFNTFTEVTGIKVEKNKVVGVETDKGHIATNCVVNATNGFSKKISEMVEVDIPVYSERHQILVTEPVEPMQGPMVMSFGLNLYVQQSPHGSFIMGRGDANEPRDLRITSSWHFIEEMAKTIDDILPPISKLRVIRQWAGLYNMTPDKQPIYDKAENIEGFYMAVGFSGHGFMFGPITGVVMSEMILGEKPTIDVSMLNLNRFKTGNLLLEPSVV
ncbi:sarcosine oxidase subunit beta [Sedimentibacter acidaminivorans]|uniref:Sarcosine oxidase subunit beta n=1 Tax=Sedimentibacter acidaminivorans TaxID=913099 RepID=A0ABS4GBI9_9FIRM|nr:FAD-binding oxidoreductase [Sedimentibacter acidaminivorans]MBP1925053.1 sarcosine oxidase subunit beta [Sedimentibacter acidaminivorans]